MSEAFIERMVTFAESGNQQKIMLNGQTHQGWIMEISEDKTGKDIWIKFTDLEQAQLSYWDNQTDQWADFKI